ncbi:MAG: hypothetical protein M0P69_17040 [Bacteroidales bacterium]|nr:hypothetical protein [Bacteroidales bacterium]
MSFDDMIRQSAGKKVDNHEAFKRGYRKPLEGEELERETARLFGEYLRWQAYDRQRRKNERMRRNTK